MKISTHALSSSFSQSLLRGLEEDGWQWDWTTLGLDSSQKTVRAVIVAKSPGVFCGNALFEGLRLLAKNHGIELTVESRFRDGDKVAPSDLVVESLTGPAGTVLAVERSLLNLLSFASGIATKTASLVRALDESYKGPVDTKPRVACTRKTLPGFKDLSVYGVLAGGGYPHRLNLASGVLIKENHIELYGGIRNAVLQARKVAPHSLKVEIEVKNLDELKLALEAKADIVMLDNFSMPTLKEALQIVESSQKQMGQIPMIEVSGGIDETNIGGYALPGVDVISSGSLTHSFKALDLSLLIQ